jgi:hypothetical protein
MAAGMVLKIGELRDRVDARIAQFEAHYPDGASGAIANHLRGMQPEILALLD